ncbi:MAG: response regulator [Prolixibacteraceae bacterium]|nr:response regulator [Prolixibacteraceae bacterium]
MTFKFQHSIAGCFLAVLLLSGFTTLAQNNRLYSNLKVNDGLPSNEIFEISQDSMGFIWLATNDGFVRYDGHQMKVYRKNRDNNIALSNNQITAIENGRDLGLWVSSYEGLMHFDTKTGTSKAIDLGGKREIRCLLNQGDSILWAGSSEGLFKINTHDFSYQIFTNENSSLGSNIVRSLYLDADQQLWVGTFDGINRLDNSGAMDHFILKGNYKPELKNNLVLDIQPYSNENDSLLLIGTETGLVLLNRFDHRYTVYNAGNIPIENEVVKCIFTPREGEIFFGTDFGFYFLNLKTQKLESAFHDPFNTYSISNNVIWDIFEDHAGIIWLATSNGISKLNVNQHMFQFTPVFSRSGNEIIGTQVNDLYCDRQGTIWLATKKGVIAQHPDGTQENFTALEPSKNRLVLNNINTISGDYLGRIWIGSAGGINVWDPARKKMHTITADFDLNKGLRSNYIGAFIAPSDGSFWVTTWGGGMYRARGNFENPEDIVFEYVANFNTNVFSTHKKIWLKNENKVFAIDLNTLAIENSQQLNKALAEENIASLLASSKGVLWIGTHNLLISYNIQTEEIVQHDIYTGSESAVFNLQEDQEGNIWGTTLTTIFKYIPHAQTMETFPKNEGLPLDNFLHESKALASDGRIFFGGNDGFISFDPKTIRKNTFQPQVLITSLRVNNKNIESLNELNSRNHGKQLIPYSDELVLRYDQHSFTIGFSSLHFGEPGRNIYAYRLENYHNDWTYTSGENNVASFSNLSAGKYRFVLRGTNNDGVWSEKETSLLIVIKPPFWASPLALVIYFLLLQLILILLWMAYRNKLRWKEQLRLITMEKEKNEAIAMEKQRFFTNISHEFRTPLSLIMGPVESMLKRDQVSGHDRQLLQLISKNTQRLFSLVNQLLDIRKIETNTLKLKLEEANMTELCEKQFNLFIDLAETQKIDYRFEASASSLPAVTDVVKLESMIQNLLSNAFKFTPEKGSITLKIEATQNDAFLISVKDTGIGIDEDIQNIVFKRFFQGSQSGKARGYGIGLNIAKEYTEIMNGKIWFDSIRGKGTTFYIELPANKGEQNRPAAVETRVEKQIKAPENGKNKQWKEGLPVVLVVDDQPDILEFLSLGLGDHYSLLSASNGKEGFELLDKTPVDLIISDIMMPVVDGIEFCEKVKQHPRFSHLPIILLTAKTVESQKAEAYRAGTDAFMTKPFDMEVLIARIEGLLHRHQRIDDYIKRKLIVENQKVEIESSDEKLLQEAIQYINEHLSDPEINLEKMCRKMGVSHSSLYRKIKALTGMTVNELIRNVKLNKAAQLIKTGKLSISEVMDQTGFTNHSYFAKCFKKVYKVVPKEYK